MTDDLEQEIRETREHLGETVDALAAKLDVKSRAQDSLHEVDKRKAGAVAGVLAIGVIAAVVLWPGRR